MGTVSYEKYPGSINDISQLEFMLDRAYGYGYRKIGFILDRGYFSRQNLEAIRDKGYSYLIMVKGMASFVNGFVLKKRGTFEEKRVNYIEGFEAYGTTIETKLFATDEKNVYVHIYHSIKKESAERTNLEDRIRKMKQYMKKHTNEVKKFGSGFEQYFILHYNEKTGQFQFAEERVSAIETESKLAGYYCIISSEKMTAKEALIKYKSRDASEKLFRGDKSYLGNNSLRVYTDESAGGKIFIEFVALIVRNRIYTYLQDEMKELEIRPNYMTVPAALKELEKIEMVRLTDNVYRMDHAVTKTQKTILKAFGMDAAQVKYQAAKISEKLVKQKEKQEG